MDKQKIIKELIKQLTEKFNQMASSAEAIKEAATNEESKAENKYDTRSLEASYLASAQAKRALELKSSIDTLRKLELKQSDIVILNSLVKVLDEEEGKEKIYLILATRGGEMINVAGEKIFTVTLDAPITQSLMGKRAGATFEILINKQSKGFEIIEVY